MPFKSIPQIDFDRSHLLEAKKILKEQHNHNHSKDDKKKEIKKKLLFPHIQEQ